MRFVVDAVPAAAFERWVAQAARSPSSPLTARNYRIISRQTREGRELIFPAVQEGLFDAVVAQKLAPAAGPPADRAATDAEKK